MNFRHGIPQEHRASEPSPAKMSPPRESGPLARLKGLFHSAPPQAAFEFSMLPGLLEVDLGSTEGLMTYLVGPLGVCSAKNVEILAPKFDQVVSIGFREDYPSNLLAGHSQVLVLQFDDVQPEREAFDGGFGPNETHVQELLGFIKPERRILFHCMGGISRSPACAMLAALHLGATPKQVVDAMNPQVVGPNPILLRKGEKVLGLAPGALSGPVQDRLRTASQFG